MPEPQEPESFEVDLFTVLTALGSGLHADLTPISEGGQYALANALALTDAEMTSALTNETFVAVRKLQDELIGLGSAGRFSNFIISCISSTIGNVLAHTRGKEQRILQDNRDLGPQRLLGDLTNVAAIKS